MTSIVIWIRKIEVAELRMLRLVCVITRSDRIKNEHIRGKVKVVAASAIAQDKRLQLDGHVRRRGSEHFALRTMEMKVTVRGKRGGPRLGWKDRLRVDIDERQMEEDQAMNRNVWG